MNHVERKGIGHMKAQAEAPKQDIAAATVAGVPAPETLPPLGWG